MGNLLNKFGLAAAGIVSAAGPTGCTTPDPHGHLVAPIAKTTQAHWNDESRTKIINKLNTLPKDDLKKVIEYLRPRSATTITEGVTEHGIIADILMAVYKKKYPGGDLDVAFATTLKDATTPSSTLNVVGSVKSAQPGIAPPPKR